MDDDCPSLVASVDPAAGGGVTVAKNGQSADEKVPEENVEDVSDEEEDLEPLQDEARAVALKLITTWHDGVEISSVDFVAKGGYNHVWKIIYVVVRSINWRISSNYSTLY